MIADFDSQVLWSALWLGLLAALCILAAAVAFAGGRSAVDLLFNAIVASAVAEALTPSRWQVVVFGVVFVWPWVCGSVWLSAHAVRFVFRVWGWLT